jgi:alanine dehydrogenase
MSAVAGNMALTMGNYYLAKFNRGRGMLLGSILGRKYGSVMVLGDGVVGRHAAKTAAGMGAEVMIFSRKPERAAEIRQEIAPDIDFRLSSPDNIAARIPTADLVVGAVLQAGARAEKIVTEAMVKTMTRGSVIVDVSIDQGGCIETSRPTSHTDPVFEKHGVIHYCVTNMPGAYPRTSTVALTSATLPYIRSLAARGIEALRADHSFSRGLNTYKGKITCRPVAESLGLEKIFQPFWP